MSSQKLLRVFATAAVAGTCMFLASKPASAMENATQIKLGEYEYMGQCAACHGPHAKGDGPVAEVLTQKPADLTQISKKYGGTFPADEVYRIIDGTKMINPHGDRQMPVWGFRYMESATAQAGAVPHDVDAQELVAGRITSLVQFLESIQAK